MLHRNVHDIVVVRMYLERARTIRCERSGGGGRKATSSASWGIVKTPHKHGTETTLKNLKYCCFTFVSELALSANQIPTLSR